MGPLKCFAGNVCVGEVGFECAYAEPQATRPVMITYPSLPQSILCFGNENTTLTTEQAVKLHMTPIFALYHP